MLSGFICSNARVWGRVYEKKEMFYLSFKIIDLGIDTFFKFIYENFYSFFAALGLCCCMGFSLVASSCLWVSHCGGLSCCGARGLGSASFSGFGSGGSRALEHRLNSCGAGT